MCFFNKTYVQPAYKVVKYTYLNKLKGRYYMYKSKRYEYDYDDYEEGDKSVLPFIVNDSSCGIACHNFE